MAIPFFVTILVLVGVVLLSFFLQEAAVTSVKPVVKAKIAVLNFIMIFFMEYGASW
jgi:hypothetical protein